ncbi:MAG: class I SAM-dependent methyltransferase [Lewinellaceae bacterium]|nr:class I SAM-dependent methyltransferase [Phaeodactylibacter sp.]MCB0615811.1 class I SAM-dependent methyltransferase [Phaeodactylibacter sp.]MCB9350166.1 class I SAM-dependent methyltransferase [Lewinellaceae bacterium]
MQQEQREIVEAFYDGFQQQLIKDYLLGNPRIVAAIRFMQEHIRAECTSILDIGCGMGWSSYEFARFFPGAAVLGVDISSGLIRLAGRMFSGANLAYTKEDVTSASFSLGQPFDAITLIDVYEHIPVSERSGFHHHLNRLLSSDGQLLIATPTPLHQQWLREHAPEGLQPVDEDVTLEDMQALALALGGQLTVYHYHSIWNTNDYFHALIERQPKYQKLGRAGKPARLTPKFWRLLRTLRRLSWRNNPIFEPDNLKYFLKTFFSTQ